MSEPTDGTPPLERPPSMETARPAMTQPGAVFWIAQLSMVVAAVILAVALPRHADRSVMDRVGVGMWALLFLSYAVELTGTRRVGRGRAETVAYATSAAGSLCMVISQASTVESVSGAFVLPAGGLLIAALVVMHRQWRSVRRA